MSVLTFRNRRGELVEIPAVAATRAKNEFGAILDQASSAGAVAITRHDAPKAVLLSLDEFQSLVGAHQAPLEALSNEFDALLERLQAPTARNALDTAFNASPAELGRAAVREATRGPGRSARRAKSKPRLKSRAERPAARAKR